MSKLFNSRTSGVTLSFDDASFNDAPFNDVISYFKMFYRTDERFNSEFLEPFRAAQKYVDWPMPEFTDKLEEAFKYAEPFTYAEAFNITEDGFRMKVFNLIDVSEMIESLGHKRIHTDGKKVTQKVYSESGQFLGYQEFDNIYEIHEVDASALMNNSRVGLENINTTAYALKCWCTSTNKEHWLWIEEKYKDNPLEAVASTFRVHENLIPHIKEIKRQGDILLVELNEDVEPSGNIIPLTSEQYFGYLTCQS
jgi:hypothetical protein